MCVNKKRINCKQGFPWSGRTEGHKGLNHRIITYVSHLLCHVWGLRKWYRMAALPGCPTTPTESCVDDAQLWVWFIRQADQGSVRTSWSETGAGWPPEVPSCLYRLLHSVWDNRGYTQSRGLSVFLFCFAFFSAVYYCGSDVFTKTKQPFIFMVCVFLVLLNSRKLSWLRNVDSFSGANTDLCPPVRALVSWWKLISWVSVTVLES